MGKSKNKKNKQEKPKQEQQDMSSKHAFGLQIKNNNLRIIDTLHNHVPPYHPLWTLPR